MFLDQFLDEDKRAFFHFPILIRVYLGILRSCARLRCLIDKNAGEICSCSARAPPGGSIVPSMFTAIHTRRYPMAIRLGDDAPNFTADTTEGTINFHEWLGNSWGILFSHPKDYTPVCTTELGTVAKISPEFKKRGVKVIAVSVDPMDSHKGWINDINETQKTTMNYPIIADPDKKVATLYDMIHPNAIDNMTVRSVFIIGPDKKVKLTLTYPASCGRNFDELLRVIDSLQLTSKYKVATPANWKDGEDCIITPAVSDAEAKDLFPKGFKTVKPYLRYTPQPNR